RSEGVSDEELTNARDYLIGILPLQMQTTGQLASALAELVTYGLPLDYYDNYRDRIAAVTAEDIRRVAREHMRPETFAIVVVGDAASVREGIEGLKHGTVYEVKPNGGTAGQTTTARATTERPASSVASLYTAVASWTCRSTRSASRMARPASSS